MIEQAKVSSRSKYSYAVSGIGRDMIYALYSTYLIVFLTDALGLPNRELVAVGAIMAIVRIWDAINDPIMGVIVDNTKTRFGKFKPWILTGAISSALVIYLLFQDFNLTGTTFLAVFALLYLLSDLTFTMNDISYWSMYPSFTTDPKEREKIGALARIFASLGLFITVALVPPIFQNYGGGPTQAFSIMALVIGLVFILSQAGLCLGVKENKNPITHVVQEKTKVKDILKIIFKNDQLLVIIVAIFLFNTGYFITTSLGIYFFNYDFNKYGGFEFTIFSAILAVSQLTAVALFPVIVRKTTRKNIFTMAIGMMAIAYAVLMGVGYLWPMNMVIIGLAGFILFGGQGLVQVVVLVMLADTIEYGQWKLGTRNESVIFAINPFVVKLATSVQTLVIAVTLAATGLNQNVIMPVADAKDAYPALTNEAVRAMIAGSVTGEMLLGLRMAMIIVPLILIIAAYLIYRFKFKIDSNFYHRITTELSERILSR